MSNHYFKVSNGNMGADNKLGAKAIKTLKLAGKYMGLSWKMIAARPAWSSSLLNFIDLYGIEAGCEEWGNSNGGS